MAACPCKPFTFLITALIATALHAQTPRANHPSSPAGVQRVTLTDTALNIPAMSMQIPAGWHFRGDVVRNINCSPGDPFPEYRLENEDGSIVIQMMTPFFTVYPQAGINLAGCGMAVPAAPTGVLLTRYILPAIRRGMQASAPEPVPGSEELVRSLSGRGNMQVTSGDAARVHLSYTSPGGSTVEEFVAGITQYTQFQGGGMHGGFTKTVVMTIAAPQGKLQSVIDNVVDKLKLTNDPQWQQRSMQMAQQQTQQIQQQGAQARAGMAANAQQQMQRSAAWGANNVANIQQQGAQIRAAGQSSQAAIDNAAAGTANSMTGKVTLYRFYNSSTGQYLRTQSSTPPGPGWVAY